MQSFKNISRTEIWINRR